MRLSSCIDMLNRFLQYLKSNMLDCNNKKHDQWFVIRTQLLLKIKIKCL